MNLFPRLDRLTLRLVVGIAAIVIVPLALGLYALSSHHTRHTIETQQRAAQLQVRILETALRHEMVEKDNTLMAAVLDEVGRQPDVQQAMILDHEGVVRLASRPELVGTSIERESPTCQVCHAQAPSARDRWVVLDEQQTSMLRSVQPIENRPECHACHDADRRLNGILILDTSLAPIQAQLERDAMGIALGSGALAMLLLGGVSLLIRRLLLVRLAKLGRTARTIAAGKLDEQAEVGEPDMIGALASDFNQMASAVSGLVSEVREQQAQMTSVINSLDDGLIVLDRELEVVAANRAFGRRFGVLPGALCGQRCYQPGPNGSKGCSNQGECLAALCLASAEGQRATFHFGEDEEHAMVAEVHASPVFDDEGRVERVVEVWRDISERVREEKRLLEIERLASLGVLASGFSHEVNTPLASMLTCAEASLARIDQAPDAAADPALLPALREHAEVIRNEVMRCRKITERFLRFSRGIPPSIEPLELSQVVQSVVALVGPTAREAKVRVKVEGESVAQVVSANTEVVQHVLLNLLVNAIQSCDERGGNVSVAISNGSEVRVRVRDDGCGIDPESRAQLFEPFRTRKPAGTGLGLFLSRSFMRRFGGDVRLVDSTPGEGSCFEVVFPGVRKEQLGA